MIKRQKHTRTQVSDLDDNGATEAEAVARAVGAGRQFPAGAARGSCACAGADAEFVLGYGGRVAGLGVFVSFLVVFFGKETSAKGGGTNRSVEAAGRGGDVAVARAPGVGGSVLGKGGLVAGCC